MFASLLLWGFSVCFIEQAEGELGGRGNEVSFFFFLFCFRGVLVMRFA